MLRAVIKLASFAGLLLGILSLVTLAKMASNFGLSAPVAALLSYYDTLINVLFSWAEPIARAVVTFASNYFSISIQLDPAWKHILVLLWLYFGADARANLSMQRLGFATFTIIWGALVGFIGSVATGANTLTSSKLNLWAVAVPICAVVVFEFGRAVWSAAFRLPSPALVGSDLNRKQIFGYFFWRFPFTSASIGIMIIVLLSALNSQNMISVGVNPNFLALGIFFLSLTVLFIGRGISHGYNRSTHLTDFSERVSHSGSWRVGRFMIITILGAVFIVLANAGLSQLGL